MWNRNFILLTLSNLLLCVTYYAVISVLPIYLVSELHAVGSQVGVVLAAYTIASVFIRPFAGFALDTIGRRTVLLVAVSLYTLFFAGYLVMVGMIALIVLRFLQGLTWGMTTISSSTIAVDIIPVQQRGEGIGYFALSTTLGMSVGPLLGLFACQHWGYTIMFLAGLGVSMASLTCAILMRLPVKLQAANKPLVFSWANLFDRKSVLPSVNMLVVMISYGGLLSFIALYGREIGVSNTSLFFFIFAIGIAASRLTVGKAFDKNGPKRILTICLALLIVGFPFLALVKHASGFYLSALIIGFGIGVVFPTFQTMVNNLSNSNNRGAANSTLFTALDSGMGLGMLIAGFVAQHVSISAVFYMNAGLCCVGLAMFRKWVLGYYEANREIIRPRE